MEEHSPDQASVPIHLYGKLVRGISAFLAYCCDDRPILQGKQRWCTSCPTEQVGSRLPSAWTRPNRPTYLQVLLCPVCSVLRILFCSLCDRFNAEACELVVQQTRLEALPRYGERARVWPHSRHNDEVLIRSTSWDIRQEITNLPLLLCSWRRLHYQGKSIPEDASRRYLGPP